ncbi:MAG: hypothetical protein EB015_12860 [Methylocystaceae bacterium]|nr:hypothetical protein [Methylocystaceae bacterium]
MLLSRLTANETRAVCYRPSRQRKRVDSVYFHLLSMGDAMSDYDYLCLLYRLSTESLELMLKNEDDRIKREMIAGEIEARR